MRYLLMLLCAGQVLLCSCEAVPKSCEYIPGYSDYIPVVQYEAINSTDNTGMVLIGSDGMLYVGGGDHLPWSRAEGTYKEAVDALSLMGIDHITICVHGKCSELSQLMDLIEYLNQKKASYSISFLR